MKYTIADLSSLKIRGAQNKVRAIMARELAKEGRVLTRDSVLDLDVAFISHPYSSVATNTDAKSANVASNVNRARMFGASAAQIGTACPVVPHLMFDAFWSTLSYAREYRAAMKACIMLVKRSDAVIVCGSRISLGMAMEILAADKYSVPIYSMKSVLDTPE